MVMRAPQASAAVEADAALDTPIERDRLGRNVNKVLYVVSMFPCWSETFIVREIHALVKRGVEVRVVSLRRCRETLIQTDAGELMDRVLYPNSWRRNLAALGAGLLSSPVRTLRHPARIIARLWTKPVVMAKSLVSWFRGLGLLKAIRAFDPDHVHAHWATYASTAAMSIADQLDVPYSFTAHAHDIYLEDHLMNDKLRSAAFVATISRFNREYLRRRYPAAGKARIEIVRCGVPRRPATDTPARESRNVVLSVGRLDEIKGFPVLLEACRQLRDAGLDFTCQVIGEGPQREQLQESIRRHRLGGCVELLGAQPSQVVNRKLAQARLFVLASQQSRAGNMDGIPVALMEALAAGTPVVSTRVSGIPELIEDQRTGLLVPPADPDALARAIHTMLHDEALRRRCAEAGMRKVREEFDADTEGARLLAVIRSLTGELHAQKITDHH